MEFNPATAAFKLEFTLTVTSAPTEIYLNEDLHYPGGHKVTVTPEGCFDITSPMSNYIHLNVAPDSSCSNQAITVQIVPQSAIQV